MLAHPIVACWRAPECNFQHLVRSLIKKELCDFILTKLSNVKEPTGQTEYTMHRSFGSTKKLFQSLHIQFGDLKKPKLKSNGYSHLVKLC
jgi:hypothetical protein